MAAFEVDVIFKRETEFSHRAMASKAPQGTQVTQEHRARRALQETGAPKDWASPAPKASVVSPETPDYPDHQAFPVPPAPLVLQDK